MSLLNTGLGNLICEFQAIKLYGSIYSLDTMEYIQIHHELEQFSMHTIFNNDIANHMLKSADSSF